METKNGHTTGTADQTEQSVGRHPSGEILNRKKAIFYYQALGKPDQ
jgi:hypothetical protein